MDNDKHFKVTGLSTDECHSHLISLINKLLGAEDLIPANRNGDRFFGLTLPPVRMKLQEAPESKFCTGYIPLEFQVFYVYLLQMLILYKFFLALETVLHIFCYLPMVIN